MNESMNRKGRNSNAETTESMDPVSMLKEDHSNVKKLFEQFEGTDDERVQMEIAKKAINELKAHAAIEEEIFYPGVGAMVDDTEVMSEATQEHHVVHFLIDELESEDLDHDTFHAKFIVLAENVRHHIKEEEGEMLPKIDSDEPEIRDLGARMAERKQELTENPDAVNRKTSTRSSARQATQSRETNTSQKATRSSARGESSGSSAKDGDSDARSRTRKSGKSRSSSPRASR
jgi:hemerythrin superfamily protein